MVAAIGEALFQRLLARARPIGEGELRRLSPMLILAPHPDDETLGCGGLLATASALELKPRVAYLTDGSASHRGSRYWNRERLSRLRREEARAALKELGVPPSDILFLNWRDAAPHAPDSVEHGATVLALKRWTESRPPASVWSAWSGEAHGDHVAAAGVAAALQDDLATRPSGFAFIVWGWIEAALEEARYPRSLSCPATIDDRTRALSRHQSQTTDLISDSEVAFSLSLEMRAITSRSFEVYLELP